MRRRTQKFEPLVLNLLETPAALQPLTKGLWPKDRSIIEQLLLRQAGELAGEDRDHMTGALEELGYVDEMIRGLGSKRWWRRLEAASKLGVARSRWSMPSLLQTCHDPAEEVRLAAVRSLGELNDTSGLRLLFQAMEDGSQWTPERVADSLLAIGPAAASEVRAEIELTTQPEARRLYIRVARLLEDVGAIDVLCGLMSDPDGETRKEAARALGGIPDPGSVKTLERALSDQDGEVRAEASRALGILQDRGTIEALFHILRDPVLGVRYNAAWALSQLGTEGHNALVKAVESGDALASGVASQLLVEKQLKVDSLRA